VGYGLDLVEGWSCGCGCGCEFVVVICLKDLWWLVYCCGRRIVTRKEIWGGIRTEEREKKKKRERKNRKKK
jgi:hypothetical protein